MSLKKDLLVDTADLLFSQNGFHATGIDLILKESKISKATLYKHFSSKDKLICAVLVKRQQAFINQAEQCIKQAVIKNEPFPVLAIFDRSDKKFQQKDYYGCQFIRAGFEFPLTEHDIHINAKSFKDMLIEVFSSELKRKFSDLSKNKNLELAQQILYVLDGAIVSRQVRGDKQAAKRGKKLLSAILNNI